MTGFNRIPPTVDFPRLDSRVLDLWDRLDAFTRSVEQRPKDHLYTFYDGPPFASGSMHYGHLLAGIIKDIIPRFWTMQGYRVERRFGWDTHGLPVEMEVERELGISGPRQIHEFGVDKFNEACRALVNVTTEEWETITRRIGRWVDFENDYKTMDVDFMETVWWVFKQLWDKDLVYRDFKVLPYSFGAATPLSNFELNLGGYRDVVDPSITVRFRVRADHGPLREGDWLLAWTTTPWTIPANLAITVGPDIEYGAVEVDGERYWVATKLVESVFDETVSPVVVAAGAALVGTSYDPPFDQFADERANGAFVVIPGDDVTTDEGTGLVHSAPAYGEADFDALQAAGITAIVDPIDWEARFDGSIREIQDMNVKDADPVIVGLLKERGALVKNERTVHSYPFCYRTDTPLIYKAIPTWFVGVESFRDRMVELNDHIHWVPEHVGSKRFGNWLEGARDWAISRNRYWGSCIPVWECSDCNHQVCVGSRGELRDLSGVYPDDLHKHIVDEITFPCPDCADGTMVRVPEVLDCWFESGSMPYAQLHYPFENRERFEAGFPADFIAEGLDQTRGWFYTLVVLASALFDDLPFNNVIVNGMILAEDGRKMSKRLKNYPDPEDVLDSFGADAIRAYLIDSPVLRAEPFRFSEDGVKSVVRTVLLPLWNAYSFFTTYAEADGITQADLDAAPPPSERSDLDRWVLSTLQTLVSTVDEKMKGYYLYEVIGPTLHFIDDLTNWYVRRSRRRFWRSRAEDPADKLAAFATLYEVLVTFSKVLAPVLPFITEEIYQGLVADRDESTERSIHLARFPEYNATLVDHQLESDMATVRSVVTLAHSLRAHDGVGVRQPLAALTVMAREPAILAAAQRFSEIVTDELNVKTIVTSADDTWAVQTSVRPDFKVLGPRLGGDVQKVAAALSDLTEGAVADLVAGRTVEVAGFPISPDDVVLTRTPLSGVLVASEGPISVALDTKLTPDLVDEGRAREVINRVQNARREADLHVSDRISLTLLTRSASLRDAIGRHTDLIAAEVLATSIEVKDAHPDSGSAIGEDLLGIDLVVVAQVVDSP